MKCKYCNIEIEQDAQFCPNCGKNLSKISRCIKCGELLDRSDDFCPFCGTKQISDEQIQSIEVTEPLQHEEKKTIKVSNGKGVVSPCRCHRGQCR